MSGSRLGRGSTLKGTIHGEGTIEILGTFEGTFDWNGLAIVGAGARAKAEGRLLKLDVHGELSGNLRAEEEARVRDGGSWLGGGVTACLVTEAGARLEGPFSVRGGEESGTG